MKKGLMFLMTIISFLGINTVSAEEIYLEYDTNVNRIKSYIDEIGYESVNNTINDSINYYNSNLSIDYPYYFITLTYNAINYNLRIQLLAFSEINYNYVFNSYSDGSYYQLPVGGKVTSLLYEYNPDINSFSESNISGTYSNPHLIHISPEDKQYRPYSYYYSNFNLYYKGSIFTEENDVLHYLNPDDTLYFPLLDDSSKYSVHKANTDFLIEPYYLYDGNESLKEQTYTTINLNDYAYVALSLKDYNTIPENNYSTYTNIYVKGQLCSTPVYNYGQTERKEILQGSQVQACTSYYDDFTLVRKYILKTDVENHAIYYLKGYDSTKENIVKIDSSIYNITYITEENKDNPQVNINGKIYPTLPYDSLTDTATKSEDEGYISGVVCAVGDLNCYNENNSSNIFNDLFEKPLDLLKDIWSSVTSIFSIIGEFISLLPETMQSFLYLSFMIAIVLGLIKIIL